jgi:hypothetical protein
MTDELKIIWTDAFVPVVVWRTEETHKKPQSWWPVSRSRFERSICRRKSSVLHSVIRVYRSFVFWYSGGWGPNSVHSALRPPIGLLCQPRVIMMMEKLVEWWLAGETEVLGENLPQCRFVHHKPHMPARKRTRAAAVGSQRLTAWAMAQPSPLCFNILVDSS